ncbi:MAG: histone deacetylase [Myxococcota bacterium]
MHDPRLLVFTDPQMAEHDPGPGMPERSARLAAATAAVADRRGVEIRSPTPIGRGALLRAHDAAYLDAVLEAEGRPFAVDHETRGSAQTVMAARLAAGAVTQAALAVIDGPVRRAFALVRPPGHHAMRKLGMGFCFFNNVVVAALAARAEREVNRVLVIDWDVHHGNGTEDIFRGDEHLLFFSTHQGGQGFYPGTGLVSSGNALNVPLSAGAGDAAMLKAFREVLKPAADHFNPDLVLVSAGFDAHQDDPLAGLVATPEGFAALCREVIDIAETHAEGRLVLALEGGYDLPALTACIAACTDVLVA